MYDEFDGPEPYENDLDELGNREAWEDAQAERDEWDDWENENFLENSLRFFDFGYCRLFDRSL